MTSKLFYVIAALAALGAGIAHAQTPAPNRDAQCLLIYGVLSSQPNPEVRRAGMMGSMYFLGKLRGADAKLDLQTALKSEYSAVTPAMIKTLQPQCNAELMFRSNELATVGNSLTPPAPPPAPAK